MYVDNTFRVASALTELLFDKEYFESICKQCGFSFKDQIFSGQDISKTTIGVKLLHVIGASKEIFFGVNWNIKNDKFFIKSNLDKN